MAQDSAGPRQPRFWIVLVGIVILLIFLYFYQPFESYVAANLPGIRADNVIFWFAALVAVVGYAVAHWQSFRRHIFRRVTDLNVEDLVFDSLQVAILIAVILCAGAILQSIEMLGAHLIARGAILDPAFGGKLLAIILLVILAIVFFLLHRAVRAFRVGWRPRRPPPGVSSSGTPT